MQTIHGRRTGLTGERLTVDPTLDRLAAAGILVAGGVHLELWLDDGYRTVHIIGPLFLANAAAALVLAVVLAIRGGLAARVAGLGYAAATLTAFFFSVYVGLFGFTESLRGTPQLVAGLAEGITIGLLLIALARSRHGAGRAGTSPGPGLGALTAGGDHRR